MEQLDVEIKADEERKAALEQQLKQLGDQLTAHEETLGRKYDERAAHARTLHEAQAAYEKVRQCVR